jgi:hypothetical protein
MALLALLLCVRTFFFRCILVWCNCGWQQVVVFSVVQFMRVRPYEAVWDRVYPYFTVSAMYDSYLNRIGRMSIVWNRVCTRVNRTVIMWHSGVNRVLGVGLGDGIERFHTIYIRSWHGLAHSWSGLHARLYIWSHTVSCGLVRSFVR